MEMPSGVFRQQQRWTPNYLNTTPNSRLVPHNDPYVMNFTPKLEHAQSQFGPTPTAIGGSISNQYRNGYEPTGSSTKHSAKKGKLPADHSKSTTNSNNNHDSTHSYYNLGYTHPHAGATNQYKTHNPCEPSVAAPSYKYVVASSPTTKKFAHQKIVEWPEIAELGNSVSLKSKIGVEYRRYAIPRQNISRFQDFFDKVENMHQLHGTPFVIYYLDHDNEWLPINNDDNLAKAIDATPRLKSQHYVLINNNSRSYHGHNQTNSQQQVQQITLERPLLKLRLEKTGVPNELFCLPDLTLNRKRKDNLMNLLMPNNSSPDPRPLISMPGDFRQISSIIDADILPATRRRVVLKRGGSDRPLGFYIRDGTYHRMNSEGFPEKTYGIFISRLVPGGLAESTNLLAENDEILEVNGVPVANSKRLDQVRDMMVANSSNLIITTRPARPFNQNANYYRMRNKNMHQTGRDRLPSTQSNGSDLAEDHIRHYMR